MTQLDLRTSPSGPRVSGPLTALGFILACTAPSGLVDLISIANALAYPGVYSSVSASKVLTVMPDGSVSPDVNAGGVVFRSAGDGSDDIPALQVLVDALEGTGTRILFVSDSYTHKSLLTLRSGLTFVWHRNLVWNYEIPRSQYAGFNGDTRSFSQSLLGTLAVQGDRETCALTMVDASAAGDGDIIFCQQNIVGSVTTYKVEGISGNDLQIDYPLLTDMPIGAQVWKYAPLRNFVIEGNGAKVVGDWTGPVVGSQQPRLFNLTATWQCQVKDVNSEYLGTDGLTGGWVFNSDWGNRETVFIGCKHVDVNDLTRGFVHEGGIRSGCLNCTTYGCRGFAQNGGREQFWIGCDAVRTLEGFLIFDTSETGTNYMGNSKVVLENCNVYQLGQAGSGLHVTHGLSKSQLGTLNVEADALDNAHVARGVFVDALLASCVDVTWGYIGCKNLYIGLDDQANATDHYLVGELHVENCLFPFDNTNTMGIENLTGTLAQIGNNSTPSVYARAGADVSIANIDLMFAIESIGFSASGAGAILRVGSGNVRRTANHATKLAVCDTGGVVVFDGTTVENKWSTASTSDATSAIVILGRANVPATITGPKNRGTVQLNGAAPVAVPYVPILATSQVTLTLLLVGGTQGPVPAVVIIPGTGLTVTGTALDTSTYQFEIV